MAKNSNKHRNIAIASLAIAVLVFSLVVGALILLTQSNPVNTPQISLSFQRYVYALQGESSRVQVGVNSIGNAENITLSSEVSLSNITCTFKPATGLSNFTSVLYVNVPDSTPTGNYTVTVLAYGAEHIANFSFVLSVLKSEVVKVSGVASSASLCNSSLSILSGLRFVNIQTGYETYVDLIGYYPFAIDNPNYPYVLFNHPSKRYSVNLMNGQAYNVAISYYCGTQGNMSAVEDFVGNFTIHVPAGETAIHKDLP
jgi:hypothetical protein